MSTAMEIKARASRAIERELARCEKQHGPVHWEKHREYVTELVLGEIKYWLAQKAVKGGL